MASKGMAGEMASIWDITEPSGIASQCVNALRREWFGATWLSCGIGYSERILNAALLRHSTLPD
jgi:hypothetical protein